MKNEIENRICKGFYALDERINIQMTKVNNIVINVFVRIITHGIIQLAVIDAEGTETVEVADDQYILDAIEEDGSYILFM